MSEQAAASSSEIKTSSILRRKINLPLWFWFGLCGLLLIPILWASIYVFSFIFPLGVLPIIVLLGIVAYVAFIPLGGDYSGLYPGLLVHAGGEGFYAPTLLGSILASLFLMAGGIILGLLISWIWRIKRPG